MCPPRPAGPRRARLLLAVLLAALVLPGVPATAAVPAPPAAIATGAMPAPPVTTAVAAPGVPGLAAALAEEQLDAAGAVLYDPLDDEVLYGREADVPRPMASLTKIMTVLLAIEAGTADDVVTVSPTAAALGEASLDLVAGQRLPMESLLAGLLLRSGNDAAVAVAEHVAGSEEAFVARMNERAAELGLVATRFVNASGLTDDPAHQASPLDLARLAEVAMGHELFARYAAAASATVPGLAPMTSRNELLGVFDGADGVKTGFTSLAGLCLVASATRDGRRLFAVVLDSEDNFADGALLLEHGFDAFTRLEAVDAGEPVATYRWAGAEVAAVAVDDLARTVPADARVTWRTVLRPGLARPVDAGEELGSTQLLVDGETVSSTPIVAAEAVGPAGFAGGPEEVGRSLQEALRAFALLRPVDRPLEPPVPVG